MRKLQGLVGVTRFELATTRPPDAYSNRAELHPAISVCGCKVSALILIGKRFGGNILGVLRDGDKKSPAFRERLYEEDWAGGREGLGGT